MRAKLTHDGQWVDIKDEDRRSLHIITPHGHVFRTTRVALASYTENKELDWQTFEDHCSKYSVRAEIQVQLIELYPFVVCHVFGRNRLCDHFSCIVTGTIKHTGANDIIRSLTDIMIHLNITLVNRVLEFDRDCERTKALQSIGNFCARMGGMKELLEFTQGVVNIVTEKQEKGPEKDKPPSLVLSL
jgi:hypothetical protein